MFFEKINIILIYIELVHQSFPEFWAPKEAGCGSVERVSAHSLNFHSLEENCQEMNRIWAHTSVHFMILSVSSLPLVI